MIAFQRCFTSYLAFSYTTRYLRSIYMRYVIDVGSRHLQVPTCRCLPTSLQVPSVGTYREWYYHATLRTVRRILFDKLDQ